MVEALLWGVVAASSLVIGALVALARPVPSRVVGYVLAFGAGALISAVAFDLTQEGLEVGGGLAVAVGLALGALTYFGLDSLLDRSAGSASGDSSGSRSGGNGLVLGSFLDGIPEQLVLGIGIAAGQGVSVGLLAAIFVSNLPEAIGSVADMSEAGRSRRHIVLLWLTVATVCALSTVVGYVAADATSGAVQAGVNGFAAGALLVMLIDSMVPEARERSGRSTGLATVLGFAVAAGLSQVAG